MITESGTSVQDLCFNQPSTLAKLGKACMSAFYRYLGTQYARQHPLTYDKRPEALAYTGQAGKGCILQTQYARNCRLTCDKRSKDLDRGISIHLNDGFTNPLGSSFPGCCLFCCRLKESTELHNLCKQNVVSEKQKIEAAMNSVCT